MIFNRVKGELGGRALDDTNRGSGGLATRVHRTGGINETK